MAKLAKLLLLVIFLAGCASNQNEDMEKSILNNNSNYTIHRADNGVYLYVDKPNKTDLQIYFQPNS